MTTKLQTYSKYKDSSIEWLGEIPSDWDIFTFKKIFKLSNERVEDVSSVELLLSVSGYRGVEPRNVESMEGQMPSEDIGKYRIVRRGQLAVNTMWLNCAGLGVSDYEGYISPAYRAYNIDRAVNKKFVHHLLRSSLYIQKYTSLLYGLRPNSLQVKNYDFEKIEILVPPLETQKRVADFLDEKTKIIDELIAKKEKMIELLREKRAVLITHAVTKGLDPKAKMKPSGIDWLGDIPEGWKVTKLRREVSFQNGHGFPDEIQGQDEGEFPFLKVSDINGEQIHISSARNYVSALNVKSRGWKIIPAGSVLTAKIGAALAVNHRKINDVECIIDNNMLAFILFKKTCLNHNYFFMLSKSFDLNWFVNPGAVPSVDMFQLKELIIPVPQTGEQKRIIDFLDAETKRIEKNVVLIKLQIDQLKEYRSSLIYSAVTGRIKV
ncbi:MAG: restriction endonuclease subunit S [Phycisphaerae bacterium]|nr:restriction endonuclease subunit S [Phycisphaerae bacterium]